MKAKSACVHSFHPSFLGLNIELQTWVNVWDNHWELDGPQLDQHIEHVDDISATKQGEIEDGGWGYRCEAAGGTRG